jgi:hypothetical protein
MNSLTPLLRLPSEIRTLTWTYVVGDNYILVDYHCRHLSRVTSPLSARCLIDRKTFPKELLPSALPILQFSGVCRQIYPETALLAYSQNVFVVDNYFFWYNNSQKPHLILPVMREAITSVGLSGLIDNYFLDSRDYPYQSLRKYFANCKSFEVIGDIEGITDFEDWYITPEDPKELSWREWVVWKLKQREGEDIEVKLGDEVGRSWWDEPQECFEIEDEEHNDPELDD